MSSTRKMTTKAGKVVNAVIKAVSKKPTVANKVARLTSQVKKLTKVSYTKVDSGVSIANNQSLASPYNTYNLSKTLYTYTPLWGTVSSDFGTTNKAYLNSKDVQIVVRQNTEPNLIRYSLFVVSLKDQAALTSLFDVATRQLILSGSGDDYYAVDYNTVVMNPKKFTIHYAKRFTMGTDSGLGPTADTMTERRFRLTLKPKQKLIENPKGNVFNNSLYESPTDPSQNYFVIIFNDNSVLDAESNRLDIQVIDHWAVPG